MSFFGFSIVETERLDRIEGLLKTIETNVKKFGDYSAEDKTVKRATQDLKDARHRIPPEQ